MKGSNYLSEMVDISMFQNGKLNLIEAPTGCGKTYFALKYIPSHVKNPRYKVVFLIDTTNGREQIMKKYGAKPATRDWRRDVEFGMIDFENNPNIVAMTYAKFGKMCEEDASFVDELTCVICDEIHNLISFTYIPSPNSYHKTAKREIEQIIRNGKATVIALTATPRKVFQWLDCEVNQIEIDTDNLLHYETEHTEYYNNLKAVFEKLSTDKVGLCYTRQIGKMLEIETMATDAGFTPICIWSTNNKDHPLTDEQLTARKELLEQSAIPERYNLLIINSSCETSIKIESSVDYVIVNSRDKDAQIQVRGRVNHDLERLYLLSEETTSVEVPEEFLGQKLFAEDREALCENLCIYKKGKNEIYKWKGIRPLLLKSSYVLQDGRERNRHYTVITVPEQNCQNQYFSYEKY